MATAPQPRSNKGGFITLEGGEGAGKSTQARMLAERLALHGYECVTTREPGGSPKAESLRTVLLSGAVKPLGPMAEALLFAAARIDHLDHTIRPALVRGAFVVCDRFTDSTRAYQGVLGDVDPGQIRALEDVTVGATRPALTFMLDLPAEVGLERASARRGNAASDRFEDESLAFHQRLREVFREIAVSEPDRCRLIDANRSAQAIADDIWTDVETRLLKPRSRARGAARLTKSPPAAPRNGASKGLAKA